MKRPLFWAAFLTCAVFLHFKNLGSTALWQDEAETAVLARNTLRYGVPKAWDGRNFVSQNLGTDHDSQGIWNYSPWLAIYLAAGSFALFGENTWTARLPFAFCSLAALLFLYIVSRRWSSEKRSADLAVWLALLSVPYLLHARQCRYYSLEAFFAMYLCYAYQDFLETKRSAAWHLPLSSLGLFHSNFLVFFAAAGGLAVHFCLFTQKKRQLLQKNSAALCATTLLLLPGCFYFHVFTRAGGENPDWLAARWENLRFCLRDTDRFVFPALLIPLLIFCRKRFRKHVVPLSFLGAGLAFLVLAPHYFFRYLVAFIPVCGFLTAELFWALHDRRKEFAFGLLALLLTTRALSISSWAKDGKILNTGLAGFLHETMHPIEEPVRAAADYLNAHGSPQDLLLVSYPDLPFMFYTPLRVIGGRSGPHRIDPKTIRWIILRDDSEKEGWPLDFSRYQRITLNAPNYPWGNRPDPDRHAFSTVATPGPAVIYKRI